MQDTDRARHKLEAMLTELNKRLEHLESMLVEPHEADSSERAVQVETEEGTEQEAILVSREIASVARALDRIAKGTYGTCVKCGGQIASARLEARPEAALCMDCVARR